MVYFFIFFVKLWSFLAQHLTKSTDFIGIHAQVLTVPYGHQTFFCVQTVLKRLIPLVNLVFHCLYEFLKDAFVVHHQQPISSLPFFLFCQKTIAG